MITAACLFGLTRLVAGAAVILHRLGRHILLMPAAEILAVRTISAATMVSASPVSKSVLAAILTPILAPITLVIAVRP